MNSKVVEVGTGCGWIATSLACERPDLSVCATDIDPFALDVARENALEHEVGVQFFESYFVSDLNDYEPDCIIAVLPYGGDATDYTWRELEERPQMPPISICDPEGALAPQLGLLESIRDKGWKCKVYLETGYISEARVRNVLEIFALQFRYETRQSYAYAVIDM